MLGNPKYKKGQLVEFECKGKTVRGRVFVVDAYGTFEQEEVSYDIMCDEENCLYKHFVETDVRPVEE